MIVPAESSLRVSWDDGIDTEFPWLWLRDHAHDQATMHPVTQQRQLDTASIDAGLRASSAVIDGDRLRVTWHGAEPMTEIPLPFLLQHRVVGPARIASALEPVLWDAATIAELPITVEHDAVMDGDDGLRAWLEVVARYGFGIVTGTPATAEATQQLIHRIAYVRETIFGGFWEFTADLAKADMAYTNLHLPAHTDGTYSHDAPGLQMLHCLAFDGEGGDSTMVDGFKIAAVLSEKEPRLFDVLASVAIPGQYIGDGVHLMSARPVFRHDHLGRLVQVSYNNADRAPFLLPPAEMTELYAALRAFDHLANDPSMQWRHVLQPGEAMLFDNWRALHGRHAYTGRRTMCGAYLNHEDFESRLRLLS
jgi:trimethyllysine dioxygenase